MGTALPLAEWRSGASENRTGARSQGEPVTQRQWHDDVLLGTMEETERELRIHEVCVKEVLDAEGTKLRCGCAACVEARRKPL